MLECDACFEDLRCLDRAQALVRELLGPQAPFRDRIRRALSRVEVARAGSAGSAPVEDADLA